MNKEYKDISEVVIMPMEYDVVFYFKSINSIGG